MNNQAFIDIQFKGEKFSPSTLRKLTKWNIESLVESGEIGKIGRYKGIPVPYGIGYLQITPSDKVIEKYTKKLIEKKKELEASNVEEIVFDIDASKYSTLNFSLNKELLHSLSQLNARVEFHQRPDYNFTSLISKLSTDIARSKKLTNKSAIEAYLSTVNEDTFSDGLTYDSMARFIMNMLINVGKQIPTDNKNKNSRRAFIKA